MHFYQRLVSEIKGNFTAKEAKKMPWNKQDYPASFKNLEPAVKEKAIEIANALIDDNYKESRAISIAMTKAREAIHGEDKKRPNYTVKHRDGDWAFMKENGEKAIIVEKTKQHLLEKAKPYVNEQNGVLKVYHEDGSLEDTLYE